MKKIAFILIAVSFLISGVTAFQGEEIELTNENLIGLAFSSMDNGEYVEEDYKNTLIGLAFCKEEGISTVGGCINSDRWTSSASINLAEILSRAQDQGRSIGDINANNNDDSSDGDTDTQDSDSEETSSTEKVGEVNRDIDYESIEVDWQSMNDLQIAALSGTPSRWVRKRVISEQGVGSPAPVSDVVRIIREDAIDVFSWQYKAQNCADFNPESCSASGNTFYVSSNEGWVLDPGTPAPHCYDGYYTPPAYGSLSDVVGEKVPRSDPSYADTDSNNECPDWLDGELESINQIVTEGENRFRWTVVEEPSNIYAGSSYDVNYKVQDSEAELSGSDIEVEFKHEDAENWISAGIRKCGLISEGSDPTVCYTSVDDDMREFSPQRRGRNLVRATFTSEDGENVQKQWEYYVGPSVDRIR